MPYQELPDLRLYYHKEGTGEPLLLLHGFGSSSQDWALQIPALAGYFEVIAPDLRGHGRSDKPAGAYSIPLFAQDVARFLHALNIEAAHVVGFSMGGMVAFQLAVELPTKLKSLVIINSGSEIYIDVGNLYTYLCRMKENDNLLQAGEWLLRTVLNEARQGANDRTAYLATLQAFRGWGVTEELDRITCPVLVVASDHDYTPLEFKQEYTRRLREGQLAVIKNCGHLILSESPQQLNRLLLDFLLEKRTL